MALRIGIPIYFQAPYKGADIQTAPEYVIPATYVNAVIGVGASPLLVPGVGSDKLDIQHYLSQIDGLLLAGGNDIDASFLSEEAIPWTQNPNPARDETEFALLRKAREMGMPILGICRGHQVLNVAYGGTMLPDVAHFRPESMRHSQDGVRGTEWHTLNITPGSKLHQITGSTSFPVNSMHHQAIDKVADGFVVTAWAQDGLQEGIESVKEGEFCVGVQFHPEDMWQNSEPIHNIFKSFAAACQKYADSKSTQ